MKFKINIDKQTISCKELPVFLYKDLLKCTYGDEPDVQTFLEVLFDIFSSLSNKPISYFRELSIIDLLSCIFQLRMNTFGDRVNINLNSDNAKKTLELRLDWANEDLLRFDKEIIKQTLIVDSVEVKLSYPTIQRLEESSNEEYLCFVQSIKIGNKTIDIKTNEEAKNITERLPIKITMGIVEYFENIVKEIRNLNFLKRYGITEPTLGFVPSSSSLLWFTKLMFNESIQSFYDNLFYLSKLANISPSFIESCSVGEYFVYTGTLQRTIAQENGSNIQDSPMQHNEPISDFQPE